MADVKNVVIILTTGKADNGKSATLAFNCALAAQALGQSPTIFLTSDGAVWAYRGSAKGIAVQGFAPLETLVEQFIESGGNILLCSVCHQTCGAGSGDQDLTVLKLPSVNIAGFTSMLELALDGVTVTF